MKQFVEGLIALRGLLPSVKKMLIFTKTHDKQTKKDLDEAFIEEKNKKNFTLETPVYTTTVPEGYSTTKHDRWIM